MESDEEKSLSITKECNEAFTKSLGVECEVKWANSKQIEFYFNNANHICISLDNFKTPEHIQWLGFYDDFTERIEKIREAITQNKAILNKWLADNGLKQRVK